MDDTEMDAELVEIYNEEKEEREAQEEARFAEKIDFARVRRGTKFWWMGSETITTKQFGDRTLHMLSRELPTEDPETHTLKGAGMGKFWEGAATTWMGKIAVSKQSKMEKGLLSIEVAFAGLTDRKSIDIKPTGRVKLVTPWSQTKTNAGMAASGK